MCPDTFSPCFAQYTLKLLKKSRCVSFVASKVERADERVLFWECVVSWCVCVFSRFSVDKRFYTAMVYTTPSFVKIKKKFKHATCLTLESLPQTKKDV